jgi:predicted RNA-binding Zn-ribbon protein involved in translation (DUF1610 family)
LNHVNRAHNEEILEHIRSVIDSVATGVDDPIVTGDLTSNSRSTTTSESSDNDESSCSTGNQVIEPVKKAKFVNCQTCGFRCKRRGLHVHMRKHNNTEDVEEENRLSSDAEEM